MNEFLESLNLPKQVLDKTDKFLSTIFGPAAKEIGELYADKIRYIRLKNQIKIFEKSIELMEQNNLSPKQLNLKTLVPLIEHSSLEEDELLQTKWAILISNIASSPESDLDPKLIKTLSHMSSLEARVLDYAYDYYMHERQQIFDRAIERNWSLYKSLDDISLDRVIIRKDTLKKQFTISNEFILICLENLIALGVVKYIEPDIQIEDDGSSGNFDGKDEKGKNEIDFELDLVAKYYQSNDIYLTMYGKYFIQKCKITIANKELT